MRDDVYDELVAEYGEPTNRREAEPATTEKYRSILPERLVGHWQTEGLGQFRDGLMFIVNPDDWKSTVEEWLQGTPYPKFGSFHAYRRTAFGRIDLYNDRIGATTSIIPLGACVSSRSTRLRSDPESLDLSLVIELTSPSGSCDMHDIHNEPLFSRALAKLGPVGWDEMYAFEPALALGGTAKLDNLVKVKWREHLSLLYQIQPPRVPYTDIHIPQELLKIELPPDLLKPPSK
jgi:hypothetical protein